MTQPAHTPTPLEFHNDPYDDGKPYIKIYYGDDNVLTGIIPPEHAAYIVKAVNAHAELVEVAKIAEQKTRNSEGVYVHDKQDHGEEGYFHKDCFLCKIKKALAKAGVA